MYILGLAFLFDVSQARLSTAESGPLVNDSYAGINEQHGKHIHENVFECASQWTTRRRAIKRKRERKKNDLNHVRRTKNKLKPSARVHLYMRWYLILRRVARMIRCSKRAREWDKNGVPRRIRHLLLVVVNVVGTRTQHCSINGRAILTEHVYERAPFISYGGACEPTHTHTHAPFASYGV